MGVTFRASANVINSTAGTSVTVSKPTGTANNDVLIAFISEVGAGSITPPAGWVLIGAQASGSDITMSAYYKVAASEGASWTWTLGASVRNWGWVGAYIGVNTSNPIANSTSKTSTTTSWTSDRFLALTGWATVAGASATRTASGTATTWTSNTTFTERFDGSTNAGTGVDIAGSTTDRVPWPVETPNASIGFTASQSLAGGVLWAVTLRPAFTAYSGGLISPVVELELNGVWTDVSAYVRDKSQVTITKGRSNSAGVAAPTRITLTFDNADGRFTEDNPVGAHYPYFQPGVRLRVSVPYGYTPPTERATAYVSSIEPGWDLSTRVAVVSIVADGKLRRLQRGDDPLQPALQRSIAGSGTLGVTPAAYWPFQDGSSSTQVASAVGGPALSVSGLTFAADSSLIGSGSLATLSTGATLNGIVPTHANAGIWVFGIFYKIPASPAADTTLFELAATGTAAKWRVDIVAGTPDQLRATAYDASGASAGTASVSFTESEVYGQWCMFTLEAKTSGSNVDFKVFVNNADVGTGISGTAASKTHGIITTWSLTAGAGLANTGVGHAFVISHASFDSFKAFEFKSAMDGYTPFEGAFTRFSRLAGEEGEPIQSLFGTSFGSIIFMGPQPATTLIAAWRETEEANRALIHDGGTGGDLVWVDRSSKYNADIRMTLDKSAGELAAPFQPVRDDQLIRNDWTVSRPGGSSARMQQTTGPMSVNPAPNGVGRYRDSKALNISRDSQLEPIAAWLVNEGTSTAKRYPVIAGDLRRSPELTEDWLNCRIGARIKAINLMSQHPASIDADVFIEGYTEVIATEVWRFALNNSPAGPYTVGVYGPHAKAARWDTNASTLAVGVNAGDTTLSVATVAGRTLWVTGSAPSSPFPIDINISGVRLRVTGISGSSSPQTFTVQRSVDGFDKPLLAGAPVTLWTPGRYAL